VPVSIADAVGARDPLPDAVLDFASPASPIDYLAHPFETLHVGSHGVENALELARRWGAPFPWG